MATELGFGDTPQLTAEPQFGGEKQPTRRTGVRRYSMQNVILKAYELLKILLPILKDFPRDQKFLLGDRIQNFASEVMELLVEAYYLPPGEQKKGNLRQVNIKLETLRYYVRLCYEQGYYSSLKMKDLNERINEVGRMTGGWLKALK
ncbi:MAG: diversity-generating retroelement protein Avd [Saprospiraceae bacterium]|nr:diversity-generating retroelement protein Avd [Saprospiraceae bacterium]